MECHSWWQCKWNHTKYRLYPATNLSSWKPLCLPFQDVYKTGGVVWSLWAEGNYCSQTQYSGCLSPGNVTTVVKCVEMHHEALSEAILEGAVHQNVCSGNCCQWERRRVGGVLSCDWKQPSSTAPLPMTILNHSGQIITGSAPLLDSNTAPQLTACKLAEGKTTHQHFWTKLEGSPWFQDAGTVAIGKVPSNSVCLDASLTLLQKGAGARKVTNYAQAKHHP